MEEPVWKYDTPCSYSNHICFSEIFYKKCYYQHSEQNIELMKKLWGDLKHNLRRDMEQTMQQTQPTCHSGINCYYLLMGDCKNQHSTFDLTWAYNIRKQLFEIECPNDDCHVKCCLYYHPGKSNQLFKQSSKKIKKLYKQAKERQNVSE